MSSKLKIRKKIGAFYSLLNKSPFPIENKYWLGKYWKVWKGTIRNKCDYDDAWFYEIASHFNNIVDVGANVGYTALLAFAKNDNCRILLIDPNPEALSIASTNMIMNGLEKKVSLYCGFIDKESGHKQKFYTVGSGAAGSMFSTHAQTAKSINAWYWVNSYSLFEVLRDQVFVPDFIKIDVEGAESLVLEGVSSLLERTRPIFMVEMHSCAELSMMENASRIKIWSDRHEYKAWYMKEGVELSEPGDIAHRGKCHLLLLPNGTEYPSYLKFIPQGSELKY